MSEQFPINSGEKTAVGRPQNIAAKKLRHDVAAREEFEVGFEKEVVEAEGEKKRKSG